ncbi:uncharacterized protein L201_001483 [Kwoniella dendrophila CBS 6074]|uniref:F-box domain-containing protein n=1 Tax=Kwoniella dendrophila CBS 6074 TaxID=1295534 RepID=A0AAX4JMF6_9TREE
MIHIRMPEPPVNSLTPLIKQYQRLAPLLQISPLALASAIDIESESDMTDITIEEDPLVNLMDKLPEELRQQIWSEVLSHPSRELQLSVMLANRESYKKVVNRLYRHIKLNSSNARKYFYGLGENFNGPSAPEENWPVSGPGIIPLNLIGLSYYPSNKISPFIRKFTLCNLVESLTINDPESFLFLLEAASECWKYNMDTWRNRVLFDQIDSLTIESPIFIELDKKPLLWKNLLLEIWNIIKGDSIILKFPCNSINEKIKEETYKIALQKLGSPSSLGQQGRLLAQLIIYTTQLDGIDLNYIAASQVKIYLVSPNNNDSDTENSGGGGGGNSQWIGCNEKIHPECLSQEAQLRRFLRRHWLIGIDNTEYIGIPPEVETVEIFGVAAYNRRRCVTGRLSHENTSTSTQNSSDGDAESSGKISLPTVLYGALEGDEQLALEVNEKVKLSGIREETTVM